MPTRNAKCQMVGVCAEYFNRMYYNLLESLTITNCSNYCSYCLDTLITACYCWGKNWQACISHLVLDFSQVDLQYTNDWTAGGASLQVVNSPKLQVVARHRQI